MTMMSSGPGPRGTAENDIYTVLMIVAFLFVLLATLYVGYRMLSLFGNVLPAHGS